MDETQVLSVLLAIATGATWHKSADATALYIEKSSTSVWLMQYVSGTKMTHLVISTKLVTYKGKFLGPFWCVHCLRFKVIKESRWFEALYYGKA